MRLLIWVIAILALLATVGFVTGFWDSTRGRSTPAADRTETSVDSTTQREPAAAEPTDAASRVCGELQQVRTLSNEVSSILGDAIREITASPGEMDETVVIARFRDAADLMELSLPGLLSSYESAAQMAPPDVAADLRAVADGTALLTPAIVDVLRNARTVQDLDGIERALEAPELGEAAIEAGTASMRLDEFTIPSCGFTFSN